MHTFSALPFKDSGDTDVRSLLWFIFFPPVVLVGIPLGLSFIPGFPLVPGPYWAVVLMLVPLGLVLQLDFFPYGFCFFAGNFLFFVTVLSFVSSMFVVLAETFLLRHNL